MRIKHKTLTQLIIQSSFSESFGVFLTSVTLLILGLIIFYVPELSHNNNEQKEVSMSLAGMGAALLLGWAIGGSNTWMFDKNVDYFTVTTSYLFVFKRSYKCSLTEINEVRLESIIDDGIKSYGVKVLTKENKEFFTGFFDYSGEVAKDLASQLSKFLNISVQKYPA
jgi:hypothetical protein